MGGIFLQLFAENTSKIATNENGLKMKISSPLNVNLLQYVIGHVSYAAALSIATVMAVLADGASAKSVGGKCVTYEMNTALQV
jgi:hypothetical protein